MRQSENKWEVSSEWSCEVAGGMELPCSLWKRKFVLRCQLSAVAVAVAIAVAVAVAGARELVEPSRVGV